MEWVPGASVEVLRGKEQGVVGPTSIVHWAPKSGKFDEHETLLMRSEGVWH